MQSVKGICNGLSRSDIAAGSIKNSMSRWLVNIFKFQFAEYQAIQKNVSSILLLDLVLELTYSTKTWMDLIACRIYDINNMELCEWIIRLFDKVIAHM
jgi:hypothetical protein